MYIYDFNLVYGGLYGSKMGIGQVFSMLESKLWYNKTENKNVKGTKKLGFIKTCDH